MKIGLVGLTGKAPGKGVNLDYERDRKHEQIDEVFAEAVDKEIELLLFPGWTSWVPQDRASWMRAMWSEVEWLANRCIKNEVAALYQISHHNKPYDDSLFVAVDPPNLVPHVFVNQLFSTGYNAKDIASEALVRLIQPGQNRRVKIGKVNIALIICGENNFIRVPEKKGKLGPKTLKERSKLDDGWRSYDLLFNPAHTKMGKRKKILDKRFAYLSSGKKGQVALHCTNADSVGDLGWWHFYGYKDGEPFLDANSLIDPKRTQWAEDRSWCILTVTEVKK